MPHPIRLGLIHDYLEERWPSMELVGDRILSGLRMDHAERVDVEQIRPDFRRRAMNLPVLGPKGLSWNVDRLLNRFVDYPRELRRITSRNSFDIYHVVDHSYAALVHALPRERTIVTCHDLDAFSCLLEPSRSPRPSWFRAMTRRVLSGLRKAAKVVCDSEATRSAILEHRLLPPERLRTVYLGTHPECSPEPDLEADGQATRLLGPSRPDEAPELLHVGSNIPRKRIDVLLKTFAGVRRVLKGARLVKVGGELTAEQWRLAEELEITEAIVSLRPFSPRDSSDRAILAALYRRASLVLFPSEAEGFGLPAVEAIACGAPLLLSDIPVLREIAGDAACHRPVGDVPGWIDAALRLIDERRRETESDRRRHLLGLDRARRYQWSRHAEQLVEIYEEIATGSG